MRMTKDDVGVKRMQDLIPPHGGLCEPVNRTVPAEEATDFRKRAAALKRGPISDADLSSLYPMGAGGVSPLAGPIGLTSHPPVLAAQGITQLGKALAWTIPL